MINDPDLFFKIFILSGMQKIKLRYFAYEPRDYFQRITCQVNMNTTASSNVFNQNFQVVDDATFPQLFYYTHQ